MTVDESKLSDRIRARLAELRACNNIASVTVKTATASGIVAIVVPKERIPEGIEWAMPTEPHLLFIRAQSH